MGREVADFKYNIMVIGDSTVGKTSLLIRFAVDYFMSEYISTIGKSGGNRMIYLALHFACGIYITTL